MTTIILGTAHLQSTPGKRSPDGKFREYQFSREICIGVQKALTDLGYNCVIDYIGDDMPNPEKELEHRVSLVNKLCKQNKDCIYVSIHANAAGNGKDWKKAYGWSAWVYRKASEKSRQLANCLYDACKELELKTRQPSKDQKYYDCGFYVCKATNCPAVLTENFFQDCKEECEFLMSEEGKQKVIDIHVKGIINYLNDCNCSYTH